MLDLETLSTSKNAGIVAIGACKFDISSGILDDFYRKIDIYSSKDKGFHIDVETLNWWDKQPIEARKVFIDGEPVSDVLKDFLKWINNDNMEFRVWGNGSDFDNCILHNAYRRFNIKNPWGHWNNRCYKTIKTSFPQIIEFKPEGYNNALSTANYQANHLMRIVEEMKIYSVLA